MNTRSLARFSPSTRFFLVRLPLFAFLMLQIAGWARGLAALCPAAPVAIPGVWFVDAAVSAPPASQDGLSWSTAFANIDQAISAAASGDQIWCAEGTYRPPTALQASGFLITKPLSLYGGFKGPHPHGSPAELSLDQRHGSFLATIIDGDALGDDILGLYDDNTRHMLTVDGSASGVHVIVDGFQIANGFCLFGNQTITSLLADDGGGIKCTAADLDVANVTFHGNKARNGGGIWISGGLVHPPLQGAAYSPLLHVKLSEFLDNHADQQGGGIFADKVGDSWVTNTRFDCNLATTGGGGALVRRVKPQEHLDFTNCVFWQNQTHDDGGGLDFTDVSGTQGDYARSRIVNCTMVGNFMANCNPGQAVVISTHSQIEIYNSILFYNYDIAQGYCGGSLAAKPDSIAGPATVQYSDVFMNIFAVHSGTGNMDDEPFFTSGSPPPATPFPYVVGPMFKLQPATSTTLGSVCIDAADYARLPDDLGDLDNDGVTAGQKVPIDLAEMTRFVNRTGLGENDWGVPSGFEYLDMGAYERR